MSISIFKCFLLQIILIILETTSQFQVFPKNKTGELFLTIRKLIYNQQVLSFIKIFYLFNYCQIFSSNRYETSRKLAGVSISSQISSIFVNNEQVTRRLINLSVILIQQFQMKSLSQQQIKQQQLKLLEMSGFSLAQYTNCNVNSNFFKQVPQNTKIPQLERLKTNGIKNFGLSSNANLKAFAYTLLASVFVNPVKQDVLNIIKSCLYSQEMDLTLIRHSTLPKLSNKQMKKLVVEFFFTLTYASYDDKIQDKLRKYPIVMDILVLFLRGLLQKLKVRNADDCLFTLQTKEICEILINVLDVNCKLTNSIFLFYDDRIFLFENENQEVLVGNYTQNQLQKNNINQPMKTLKLSQLQQQIDQDTENDQSYHPSMSSHNRSLQFRGVVSQSIVFEPQAPTPFFNLENDNNSSFQSNQEHQNQESLEIKRQKDSLMKGSKEMSLLKLMDRSLHIQHNTGGLGNIARSKIIENQMKQSIEQKDALAMITDSPITLDSPHTLFSDGNFGSIGNEIQIKEQIRVMKKSKSENGGRMSKAIEENNNEETEIPKDMKKKDRIRFQQKINKSNRQKKQCECTQIKKKGLKLNSNLYEINMRYVPSQPAQPKRQFYYNPALDSRNQLYINSKGISCEFQVPAASHNAHNTSLQYIRYNQRKQSMNNNLNVSMHSCMIIPKVFKDSQTQSKRQFSPISNTRERSTSPYGQTRSIASPKVTFTYQNKLKQSTQFSNMKRKNNP